MTKSKILEDVCAFKQCSLSQLNRYMATLDITSLGAKQIPAQYPEDSAERILAHLGYGKKPTLAAHAPAAPPKLAFLKKPKRATHGKRLLSLGEIESRVKARKAA